MTDPTPTETDDDLWRLVSGLRFKRGRLQQRWLRCRDNFQEWRDVPEAEDDPIPSANVS